VRKRYHYEWHSKIWHFLGSETGNILFYRLIFKSAVESMTTVCAMSSTCICNSMKEERSLSITINCTGTQCDGWNFETVLQALSAFFFYYWNMYYWEKLQSILPLFKNVILIFINILPKADIHYAAQVIIKHHQ